MAATESDLKSQFKCSDGDKDVSFHRIPAAICVRLNNCRITKHVYGTVSAKIAPRLQCNKNASRMNRYNFPTDNVIDFLFSTLHTTPFHYELLKIGS